MVERSRGLGFISKAFLIVVRDESMRGQELEGDDAAETGVFGFIHHTHPPFTQFF
jgi:hypothetical protein